METLGMIVGPPIDKQSAEVLDWTVRFTRELVVGQRLVAAVFRAIHEADGSDVRPAQAQRAHHPGRWDHRGFVSQLLKAGDGQGEGTRYIVELRVTDNVGRIFEAERRLWVRHIP
jgi:hypothetical protein